MAESSLSPRHPPKIAADNDLDNADPRTTPSLPNELFYVILRLTDSKTRLSFSLASRRGFLLVSVLRSQDDKTTAPIIEAAKRNLDLLVRILLTEKGIDPDYRDKNGKTALFYAADKGYTEIVERLLATRRVNPNITDQRGHTPLSLAVRGGHGDIVAKLLECEPRFSEEFGSSILCQAARSGYRDIVERLLTTDGINPDRPNHLGQHPLSLAAAVGHERVVELIGARADANLEDNNGRTPLSAAACNGNARVVELLLTMPGVNVNSKDKDGRTPLSVAAGLGWLKVVGILVRGNADLEMVDANGRTPLMWAEAQGEKRVVDLLIQEGAALSLATRARIYWRNAPFFEEYGIIILFLGYLVGSVIWEAR